MEDPLEAGVLLVVADRAQVGPSAAPLDGHQLAELAPCIAACAAMAQDVQGRHEPLDLEELGHALR
eukprot:5193898-Alexandrium_andersonii.AAC.1